MGSGDASDEVDFKCMPDRQLCLLVEVYATSNRIHPDRIVPQERRRHENLFELRVNAVRHVLFSESEEVIHRLQGGNGGGFDWIDESEEGVEDFCGFCDLDDGERDAARGGLRWLGEREHVVEEG